MSEEAEWPVYSSGRTTTSVKEAVRIAQSNNFMGLMCSSRLLVSSRQVERGKQELTATTGTGAGTDRVGQDGRIGAHRRRNQLDNSGTSGKGIFRCTARRGGWVPRQQCDTPLPREYRHVKTDNDEWGDGKRRFVGRKGDCFHMENEDEDQVDKTDLTEEERNQAPL